MQKYYYNDNNNYITCINIEFVDDNKSNINNIFSLLTQQRLYNVFTEFDITNKYEVGPLLHFKTPWSTNALEILENSNINNIRNIEKSYIFDTLEEAEKFYDKMTQKIYSKNDLFDTLSIDYQNPKDTFYIDIEDLEYHNKKLGLSFDDSDIEYYKKILPKKVTNVELYDLAQSNSEHSRHWFFNGKYILKKGYDIEDSTSLLKRIKSTNNLNNNNSTVAFSDNASAIRGYDTNYFMPENGGNASKYTHFNINICPTHTAETHNFPTGICPFPGASTGVGGRIRDTVAIGRGANFISGYAGYSVGDINNNNNKDYPYRKPLDILVEASNGASDYGNKIGEPIISGYTRGYSGTVNNERVEYVKPIMYCGGIGSIFTSNLHKYKPKLSDLIVRIGGPAYRIGLGGGSASSRNQDTDNTKLDFNAVQRGDPQMENKVCRFVKSCFEQETNPILSIHDQGSGGMGNVTKEIVSPNGAIISLNNVNLGDKTLSSNEIWNAEYQEQVTILINNESINLVKKIAKRENINISFVGYVNNSGEIDVYNKNDKVKTVLKFNLDKILNKIPQKEYKLVYPNNKTNNKDKTILNFVKSNELYCDPLSLDFYIENVLKSVSVCCKKFLTTKVDRSVRGLIAQQQCVGPYQLPLSNYSLTALSIDSMKGIACSIGEQPIKGLIDNTSNIEMTIGEMLTNLVFVKIDKFTNIKCLGNWMWSTKLKYQDALLYDAVTVVEKTLKTLKIGIDGGKDSLSMNSKLEDKVVMSPNTLVMSSYVLCPDIRCKVTPDIKNHDSILLFIDLGYNNFNLGGSIFTQTIDNLGENAPRFRNIEKFPYIFNLIQNYLSKNKILAGHDRSDGGLITTIIEMCISSNYGCELDINMDVDYISYLFNEELGLVIEVDKSNYQSIIDEISTYCPISILGKTTKERNIVIKYNNKIKVNNTTKHFWKLWEYTSYQIEKEQCNLDCVEAEYESIDSRIIPYNFINNKIQKILDNINNENAYITYTTNINNKLFDNKLFNVGILRDHGSNGDKEMASAFFHAGFNVYDINMNDLLNDPNILDLLNGIAFVGGFTYSDVFGAGIGWANVIKNNEVLSNKFKNFFRRKNTFSLGVCNGCQLMSLLGILPPIRFIENDSKRFESRFTQVKITDSNCIFTKDMEGCTMGIWCAHKEGKASNLDIEYDYSNTIPIKYVDDCGNISKAYPFNINGSQDSIAGICSKDGRHFALMPHPERCFLNWQMPYLSNQLDKNKHYSLWFMLFRNAYTFCENNIV